MATKPDDVATIEVALDVVRMYYHLDLTTQQIARKLGMSRPKISRLLSWARANGLIEFHIVDHRAHTTALERRIQEAFGIRTVKVVPIAVDEPERKRVDLVAMFTARYLNQLVRPGSVITLAWGDTITAVSHALVPKPLPGVQVVQMNGSGNSGTGFTYAADMVARFARAYDATSALLPIPAYFDEPATKAAMFEERSVRRVLSLSDRADVALYSIGVPSADSYIYRAGYIEQNDVMLLLDDGVVGDIATMFFRADGSDRGITLNHRSSGPALEQLRQHDHSICVVQGERKVSGIIGALRGGFMNTLIIDAPTAARLAMDAVEGHRD